MYAAKLPLIALNAKCKEGSFKLANRNPEDVVQFQLLNQTVEPPQVLLSYPY